MLPSFEKWRDMKKFPIGKRYAARMEYNRLKREENEMGIAISPDCSLACKPCPVPTLSPAIKEEGNNPMNSYASATIAAPTTETQDQRKYLTGRLNDVYVEKRSPLEAKFGLVDDDAPSSAEEFQKRITDGAYKFRTGDRYQYWHWSDRIQWRHPDRKEDQEGFDAARKELKAKKLAALDIIKIEEPTVGLKAIKDLESWEPTGAAN